MPTRRNFTRAHPGCQAALIFRAHPEDVRPQGFSAVIAGQKPPGRNPWGLFAHNPLIIYHLKINLYFDPGRFWVIEIAKSQPPVGGQSGKLVVHPDHQA